MAQVVWPGAGDGDDVQIGDNGLASSPWWLGFFTSLKKLDESPNTD
jgi:hypothetical protein